MEKLNKEQMIDHLYREVGDMLNRAKRTFSPDSEKLQKLDTVYGGVETIKHRYPTSETWWAEAVTGLEEIRDQLVTMSEDRLYTM